MTTGVRWSDDPKAYQREWMRTRRATDAGFRLRQAATSRKWQKNNPVQFSWNNTRTSARKRGYDWSIDLALFEKIVTSDCLYCGAGPSPVNGVDRVDNALGYVPGNVAAACAHCNFAKRGMTRDEFIAWARRLVHHQGKAK